MSKHTHQLVWEKNGINNSQILHSSRTENDSYIEEIGCH